MVITSAWQEKSWQTILIFFKNIRIVCQLWQKQFQKGSRALIWNRRLSWLAAESSPVTLAPRRRCPGSSAWAPSATGTATCAAELPVDREQPVNGDSSETSKWKLSDAANNQGLIDLGREIRLARSAEESREHPSPV